VKASKLSHTKSQFGELHLGHLVGHL